MWIFVGYIPYDEGSVENEGRDDDCQYDARNKAQNGVRIGKGHDGQTNVFREQERGSLAWLAESPRAVTSDTYFVPATCSILYGIAFFLLNLLTQQI